jgi:regulator of cell morphogenesis and NO signaling
MDITPEAPVGVIVAERLGRARVFDRLGIDYCCHGEASLREACGRRSLDLARVAAELAEDDARAGDDGPDAVACAGMTAGALADHIVATHHTFLRRELPRLSDLIDKVVAGHGARNPELGDLRATFAGLRQELELHLIKEERVLFPLVKQLEAARGPFPIHCGTVRNPIRVMEHEHEAAGAALERLRALTGGFRAPAGGCASLRALYQGLADLEADLHRHIHKENNILFPRAAALEAALPRAGD